MGKGLCLCCLFGPLDRYCVLSACDSQWLGRKSIVTSIPEPVLKSPRHVLQVLHPSGTSGLSTLSLLTPFVRPHLGRWVPALSACYRGKS